MELKAEKPVIIGLSFKANKEDMELYFWIKKHSNLSGFIKDILRATKENESYEIPKEINRTKKTELIDLGY